MKLDDFPWHTSVSLHIGLETLACIMVVTVEATMAVKIMLVHNAAAVILWSSVLYHEGGSHCVGNWGGGDVGGGDLSSDDNRL